MEYKLYNVTVQYLEEDGDRYGHFTDMRVLEVRDDIEKILFEEFIWSYIVSDITLEEVKFEGYNITIEKE